VIDVTSWEATLVLADEPTKSIITLAVDPASLRVREGTGGIKPLGDDDKQAIESTIEGILGSHPIQFRSTAVALDAGSMRARGELFMLGKPQPIEVDVRLDNTRLAGEAVIKQTDWGIKPYSALFGALQVADDVTVRFEAVPAP